MYLCGQCCVNQHNSWAHSKTEHNSLPPTLYVLIDGELHHFMGDSKPLSGCGCDRQRDLWN